MQNSIIIYQIGILAILVLVGIIATHFKIITESTKKGIASIVFDITLPLLIVTTFARIELTPTILRNSSLVFLFAYIVLGTMFLIGALSSKILKLKGPQSAVFINHHMFGNIVFLGFPLMDALFPGGEGLLYAGIYQLASNSIMWSVGVWIFLRGNGGSRNEVWRNMINSNTIALFIGILIMLIRIPLPDIIYEPLHGLGKSTIYLSMLYIGAMLMQTKIRGLIKKPYVFILAFNKLLFVPALISVAIYFLSYLFFPEFGDTARKVLLLEASMPCMATIVVMAHKFKSDDQLATENVFITTVFSILTIPAIYAFLLLLDQVFNNLF